MILSPSQTRGGNLPLISTASSLHHAFSFRPLESFAFPFDRLNMAIVLQELSY